MTRLEKLKIEKRIADNLTLLPFQLIPMVQNYYDREIDAIEKYGSSNPSVSEESLEKIKKFMEELKDNGIQKAERKDWW